MKNYLNNLSEEVRELIHLASDVANKNNMSVYLVGGFVRDLILGVKNLDLDIVVEGDGIKFAEVLSQKLNVGLIRHRRFGTATVILKKHLKVDIATTRQEYYPQPAHLPEVTCGVLKDDLMRRDFTINAMAISINRQDFGRFIDCFGGRQDLADKKIRVLHNLSFIDDPTRILRAIRFEQRYNFKIEPKTLKLLREANELKMLERVQPQRLRDELILILKEGYPLKPLNRIKELIKFNFINSGLSLSKKNLVFLKSVESQINWFKRKYPKRRQLDTWLSYLIGLIDPLNINNIKLICKKFAFRRGEEKRILAYKKLEPQFIKELSRDKIKASRVFSLLEPLSYEVIILIKAKFSRQSGIPQNAGKNRNIQKHVKDFFEIYNGTHLYISGADLHKLGLTPGPYYQKIFHRVLNAKLDGLVKTKKEELGLINKISKDISYGAKRT
jgi:tRNA nucleotidyltransferase (CCA-adding enzyme)